MKRILAPVALSLATALVAVPAGYAVAQQAAPSDLNQVNAYIRAVTTLTADFSQTDRNGQVLTGKLTLKQPGKIRFQYEKGVPLLIVGDGKALTLIDYEVRQVQRWPIGNSPLAALIDWLRGRPWPAAPSYANDAGFQQLGWQIDLRRYEEGALVAERASPPTTVRASNGRKRSIGLRW